MNTQELYTKYVQGAFPLVMIDTIEDTRAGTLVGDCIDKINEDIRKGKYGPEAIPYNLFEWDGYNGLVNVHSGKKIEGTVAFRRMLEYVVSKATAEQKDPSIFIVYDFHMHLIDRIANATLVPLIKTIFKEAPKNNVQLVGIGNLSALPEELRDCIAPLEFGYPSREEIASKISQWLYNTETGYLLDYKHSKAKQDRIVYDASMASLGMTMNEIGNAIRMALVSPNVKKDYPLDLQHIYETKARHITAGGLLEYIEVEEDIDSLGGMEQFKKWVEAYIEKIFKEPEKAKAFGLKMPKGVILTGIQGTGKSLAGKWLAKKLGVKCYLCDFGRVFGSLLGESERNMRTLLKQIKAVSPAVIILEEIEKSLSGQESSGVTDGGVTSRLIGSLLYDLSENTDSLSFKVATANDVFKLPPELLRKGRWDGIYFFDVPSVEELKEIYRIHIRKTGRDPNKFNIDYFATKSVGFVGAEVESVVQLALRKAFTLGKELTDELILEEIDNTNPLTVIKKTEIDSLRSWAKNKASPANTAPPIRQVDRHKQTIPIMGKASKVVN